MTPGGFKRPYCSLGAVSEGDVVGVAVSCERLVRVVGRIWSLSTGFLEEKLACTRQLAVGSGQQRVGAPTLALRQDLSTVICKPGASIRCNRRPEIPFLLSPAYHNFLLTLDSFWLAGRTRR